MRSYVVLPNEIAAGVVRRVKRQEATIEALRTRLAEREALLSRALQELAVFRLERDPAWFAYARSHRGKPARRPAAPAKPLPDSQPARSA